MRSRSRRSSWPGAIPGGRPGLRTPPPARARRPEGPGNARRLAALDIEFSIRVLNSPFAAPARGNVQAPRIPDSRVAHRPVARSQGQTTRRRRRGASAPGHRPGRPDHAGQYPACQRRMARSSAGPRQERHRQERSGDDRSPGLRHPGISSRPPARPGRPGLNLPPGPALPGEEEGRGQGQGAVRRPAQGPPGLGRCAAGLPSLLQGHRRPGCRDRRAGRGRHAGPGKPRSHPVVAEYALRKGRKRHRARHWACSIRSPRMRTTIVSRSRH